jgi:phospholipase D-like protein
VEPQYGTATASRGGCTSLLLAGIIILVPLVGDIACTVFIISDDLTTAEKVLWLAAVWLLPWAGRLLYLLIGQRSNRLLSA